MIANLKLVHALALLLCVAGPVSAVGRALRSSQAASPNMTKEVKKESQGQGNWLKNIMEDVSDEEAKRNQVRMKLKAAEESGNVDQLKASIAEARKVHLAQAEIQPWETKARAAEAARATQPDLKAVQVKARRSSSFQDPCAALKCAANLQCPAGFKQESVPGHCCPYCVNPDVNIEVESQGASGSAGGKPSTFCDKVWCFPTMCKGTSTEATTTNGLCCSKCEA